MGKVRKGALGRPPKFSEPSRVVTMTLPEATLAALEAIDADRARAVVRATELAVGGAAPSDARLVETLAVARDVAVITVPYSPALRDIKGLDLIEIVPTRYLVVLEPGLPLPELELSVMDRIETLAEAEWRDRAILGGLMEQLRSFRRNRKSRTAEVILVAI
jgi:hypothetical protein